MLHGLTAWVTLAVLAAASGGGTGQAPAATSPAPTSGAQSATSGAKATSTFRSPRGWQVPVPAGLVPRHEPTSGASATQIQESLAFARKGDLLVRLDLYLRPKDAPLEKVVTERLGFLTEGQTLRATTATRQQVPALRLTLPRVPQALAREMAFFLLGDHFVHVTCEDSADAEALAAFEQAIAGFDRAPAARKARKP